MASFQSKKIFIIGAGISGLACALGLKKFGFHNVCILEARNRIGGRIQTIEFGQYYVELGAHWIHGQENNIVYEIAKSNNCVDEKAIDYIDSIMKFNNLPEENRDIIISLIEYLDKKLSEPCTIKKNTNDSAFSYLKEQFDIFMADYQHSSVKDILNEAFDWFCKFECEINGCCSLTLLSKKLLSSYEECNGSQSIELKHGYQSILNLFQENIPNEWILKKHTVTKIDWSDWSFNEEFKSHSDKLKQNKVIKIFCENGKEFFADHVVVTVPLGYLKKYSRSLFYPCLSKKKELAISCLGFDVVNKIFLHFENPLWKKYMVINVIWQTAFDSHFPAENYSKDCDPSNHWVKSINRFAYTHGHPNMLCVCVVGVGAKLLELSPDDKVENDCMKLLELLMHEKLPKPIKVLRSAWSSDSFSLGSYSYLSLDCERNSVSHSDIAEPEYCNFSSKYPVLLFAGEASHKNYFSTVHGACESGFREAKRLFQFHNDLQNFEDISLSHMAKMLSPTKSLHQNMKIFVIGAGIAGLSCASQLIANNFSEVYVLEAQNRIGGRIHSIAIGNSFVELGAQWIHGTNNELYRFSETHGILAPVTGMASTEGEGTFYTSFGNIIDGKIVEEVKEILNQTKSTLEKSQHDCECHKSVKCIFQETFDSYLKENCDSSDVLLKKGLFDWYIKFEVIDNACDSLSTVAPQSYAEWDDCPLDLYHINTNKGFDAIFDTVCQNINEKNIFLNKPVKSIRWCEKFKQNNFSTAYFKSRASDAYPVYVECEDGIIFPADCVIVTASIGFLKENCDTFFCPPLPANKKRAFECIGFGTINKIFLIYDDVFWNPNDKGFQLVWIDEINEKTEKLLKENPWIKGITGFDVVKQLPNILVGWIGGEEAKLYEKVTDNDVCYVCTELLKLFCNRIDIPSPVKIFRSQWFLNPYVRGAYSNRNLKFYQCESSLNDLQQPLYSTYISKQGFEFETPIVLFAGEAFDEHSFSSAHGAFRSGLKTAELLINSFSKIKVNENV